MRDRRYNPGQSPSGNRGGRRSACGNLGPFRRARHRGACARIRKTVLMKNESLFERAQRSIPGGVNYPVRALRAVGGVPPFLERAAGAYLWDADGKRYIDYVGSWGPMLAG